MTDLARSPDSAIQYTPHQRKLLKLLCDGFKPEQIASALASGSRRQARRIHRDCLLLAARDAAYQELQYALARGHLMVSLPAMTEALVKRGERGRVDAIKLIYESSGYYNPRVQHDHEHSGEITINLKTMARPQPVLDEGPIVDATVVE